MSKKQSKQYSRKLQEAETNSIQANIVGSYSIEYMFSAYPVPSLISGHIFDSNMSPETNNIFTFRQELRSVDEVGEYRINPVTHTRRKWQEMKYEKIYAKL